jgi:predicted metalloendopeptidase
MQDYYKVCLDEKYINSLGPTPIYQDIAQIENNLFPVKDSTTLFSAQAKTWISQTLAIFEREGIATLAGLSVDADDKNPDMSTVIFDQASLFLPTKEYYEDPENIKKLRTGLNDILFKVLGEYSNGTQDANVRQVESKKTGFKRWNNKKIKSAVDRFITFETTIANISLKM